MNILTLIPARSGSKGIPKKNIQPLAGKPLIAHTIEEALDSKFLEKQNIICSTDSRKISKIAKRYGAKAPFLRPKKYAIDEASSISVAIHALEWMEENKDLKYEYLLLLQPTSPLRRSEHIDEAISLMKKEKKDSVVSVNKPFFEPFNLKIINSNGELNDFSKTERDYDRRQEMPEVYTTNGAIYLTKAEVVLNQKSFFGEHCVPYKMDKKSSIDIDDLEEFEIAETLIGNES